MKSNNTFLITATENKNSVNEIILNNNHTILQKQLQQAYIELQNKNDENEKLEKKILDLETSQSEIMYLDCCLFYKWKVHIIYI